MVRQYFNFVFICFYLGSEQLLLQLLLIREGLYFLSTLLYFIMTPFMKMFSIILPCFYFIVKSIILCEFTITILTISF